MQIITETHVVSFANPLRPTRSQGSGRAGQNADRPHLVTPRIFGMSRDNAALFMDVRDVDPWR